jgi:hypothetical protein
MKQLKSFKIIIKISLDTIETLKKIIKDDEEKVQSHETNILRLSSRLSSEEFRTYIYTF